MRVKIREIEKKALWSVGDEGEKQENWEKSPVVSWRWGQKTRKLRKKPCGLLETRAKNKKSEKKPCGLLETRAKNKKIEKKHTISWCQIVRKSVFWKTWKHRLFWKIHKLLIIEKKLIFNFHTLILYYGVRVKKYFAPNLISMNCFAAKQLPQFSNIRNPLIYCINCYFLMFGGSQVQKSYRASTNDFLTFWPWYHIIQK